MTPERFRQINKLFESALEREPSQRAAFLGEACAGDPALQGQVEALLASHDEASSFLESPTLKVVALPFAEEEAELMVGQHIGPYQVLREIGRGGMGEVYLARDSRLGRQVALKFLPSSVQDDPDRRARLLTEAQAASWLHSPQIAAIHDIGEHAGRAFIVMEYVEGEPLSHKLKGGPLAISEAVEIAVQVAEALEEAHGRGIVHRDIKSSNLVVTPRGQVKVLDFGLAKVTQHLAADGDKESGLVTQEETASGVVLGTVHYMSPEQARGLKLDGRTDLFSLGVVLYEMVAGRLPFKGETGSDVLVAILERQPEPLARRPEVPAELERIITKALEKDRGARYQQASELRADLKRLKRDLDSGGLAATSATAAHRRSLTWVATLLAVLAVAAVAVWLNRSHPEAPEEPLAAVPLTSYPGEEGHASFSPDGNQVAFVWDGEKQDNFDIYIKLIGGGPPLPLTRHPAADYSPAWSPDGRWIAFLRELSVQKAAVLLVPALGGTERKLAEIERAGTATVIGGFGSSLAWSPDGRSLAITDRVRSNEPAGLFLLSTETGQKKRLTSPPANSVGDHSPTFAPDSHTLVFSRFSSYWSISDLYLLALSDSLEPAGEVRRLTFDNRGTYGSAWTPDGREIVFASGQPLSCSLWRMTASGSGKPQGLASLGEDAREPAISRQGNRLAYTWQVSDLNIYRVGVPGPQGKASPPTSFISSTRVDGGPQFSPDGKRIVFASGRSSRSGGYEIWVCESDGSNAVQLTSLGVQAGTPHWSPDGERIVFDSNVEGQWEVYVISANGGKPQRLTANPASDDAPSWSRDGMWIYFASNRRGEHQVWKMPSSGGEAVPVTRKGGYAALESPDGKWLYYSKIFFGSSLWKVPVQGGEETQVVDSLSSYGSFAVVDEGIYFISRPDRTGGSAIEFLDSATGNIKAVARLDKEAGSLTVSPDSRWILYSQVDQQDSDLMLVENFR
jgi:Tol biopolymer transport system component/predicted Ser/Thr protein kinase